MAAAVAYLNFLEGINKFDGGVRTFAGVNGTGGGFAAIPADDVSIMTCIVDSVSSFPTSIKLRKFKIDSALERRDLVGSVACFKPTLLNAVFSVP